MITIHQSIRRRRSCLKVAYQRGEELTRRLSLPPKAAATASKSFSLSLRTETSQTDPATENPFSLQLCRQSASSASFREHVYTAAPNPASSSTTARLLNKETETRDNAKEEEPDSKRKKYRWKRTRTITRVGEEEGGVYPIPLVPPVTSAVIPWRDQFRTSPLSPPLRSPASAISFCLPVGEVEGQYTELHNLNLIYNLFRAVSLDGLA